MYKKVFKHERTTRKQINLRPKKGAYMRKRKHMYNEADKLTETELKELGERLGGFDSEIDLEAIDNIIGEMDLEEIASILDE